MEIYQLHLVSSGVNPRCVIEGHRIRVPVEGNQVSLDGKQLEVHGCRTASGRVRTGPVGLVSGTLVEVWCDTNGMLVCARADDVDRVRAAKAAREAAEEAALREREEDLRIRAQAFNASLAIPFRWVPGAIESESSRLLGTPGDEGQLLANNVHVLLKQGFRDGRLTRSAGDLLCMRSRRITEKHLKLRKTEAYAEVSCRECLTVAKRWRSD